MYLAFFLLYFFLPLSPLHTSPSQCPTRNGQTAAVRLASVSLGSGVGPSPTSFHPPPPSLRLSMPTEAGVLLEATELLGPGYPELGSGAAGAHGAAVAAELKRPEGRARDRRL